MEDNSFELVGKFIGADEIASTKDAGFTTPKGAPILEVTFLSGKKRIFPLKTVKLVVSDRTSDATALMQKRMTAMVAEMMEIVGEHDMKNGETDLFLKLFMTQLDMTFNRAVSYHWFKDDKEFVQGFDPNYEVSYLMAERIVRDIPKDEPTTPTN